MIDASHQAHADRRLQAVGGLRDRHSADPGDGLDRERVPRDRSRPQGRHRRFREPCQSTLDHRGDGVRHGRGRDVDSPRLRHELAELPHEQRVAGAALDDRPVAAADTWSPGRRPQQLRTPPRPRGEERPASRRRAPARRHARGQLLGAVRADQQTARVRERPTRRSTGPGSTPSRPIGGRRAPRRAGRRGHAPDDRSRSPRTVRSTPPVTPPVTRRRTGSASPPNRPAGEGSAPTATTAAPPPPASRRPRGPVPPLTGESDDLLGQPGLTDPGLARQQQRRAPRGIQVGQSSRRHRQLRLAPEQSCGHRGTNQAPSPSR